MLRDEDMSIFESAKRLVVQMSVSCNIAALSISLSALYAILNLPVLNHSAYHLSTVTPSFTSTRCDLALRIRSQHTHTRCLSPRSRSKGSSDIDRFYFIWFLRIPRASGARAAALSFSFSFATAQRQISILHIHSNIIFSSSWGRRL